MPAGTIEAAPEVLAWARSVAGLSLEDAAKRLKLRPEELSDMEAGTRVPRLGQLRDMARVYALPLSTLLMPEPLEPPQRPEDMRTVGGRATRLSAATLRVIREARERQELAADLLAEAPGSLPAANLPRATLSDSPGAPRKCRAGATRHRCGSAAQVAGCGRSQLLNAPAHQFDSIASLARTVGPA